MVRHLLFVTCIAALLASCCEPTHKDSQPELDVANFTQDYGHNVDIYQMLVKNSQDTIQGIFPIYTFAIKNTGTQDDDFTLRLRQFDAGFDITKRVPAGQTVLFRTPTPQGDSSAHYTYALSGIVIPAKDTAPNMDYAYYGLTRPDSQSVQLVHLRPTIQVIYGEVNNGPEACNTPASTLTVNIDRFPVK
jgi:hypothetical protein